MKLLPTSAYNSICLTKIFLFNNGFIGYIFYKWNRELLQWFSFFICWQCFFLCLYFRVLPKWVWWKCCQKLLVSVLECIKKKILVILRRKGHRHEKLFYKAWKGNLSICWLYDKLIQSLARSFNKSVSFCGVRKVKKEVIFKHSSKIFFYWILVFFRSNYKCPRESMSHEIIFFLFL